MTDRGRVAALLVVVSAVLTGVSSTLDMYTEVQPTTSESITNTTSLWGFRSTMPGFLHTDTVLDDGLPIVVVVALMVVAAVFTVRNGRTASVARSALLVLAGLFAGLVLAFAVGALARAEIARAFPESPAWKYEMEFLPGFHLLVAAAVIGLAGAVLAQRAQPAAGELEEETAVVVHQLADDDTPPFGIKIGRQEAR
ncbi:hypothetical protein BBK82_24725 [Lentzea guizhouensis]|uniref:Uncharacterized protein n=1 Tax=Lentzea guizhouensis TaxID=1586287 RepID=A0A1B2HM64_9PSEU|nr:hypothetical protein [Lentzea guizhouensis]ANZ38790.1 hypothetical protein BBK82_24725 [Lentzea guizhouensis]